MRRTKKKKKKCKKKGKEKIQVFISFVTHETFLSLNEGCLVENFKSHQPQNLFVLKSVSELCKAFPIGKQNACKNFQLDFLNVNLI